MNMNERADDILHQSRENQLQKENISIGASYNALTVITAMRRKGPQVCRSDLQH